MARIVVLTHEHDRFAERSYMLETLLRHWAAAGHDIRVHAGLRAPPPGDLAVLHVDRTVVPDAYMEALSRYPRAINAATRDIGKRRVSRHLVAPGDGWDGPVIVKTNRNCAGGPEAFHAAQERERSPLRRLRAAAGRLVGRRAGPPPGDGYAIYARPADVPAACWTDPERVVERFLPERDERGYWVRTWLFLGDRERCNRALSAEPIVKGRDVLAREPVPVPDEIRAERRRLGFDYGKFDFALHEGRPVLFDANRTPSVPPNLGGALEEALADLAGGLAALLG